MKRKANPKKVAALLSLACAGVGMLFFVSNIVLIHKSQTALIQVPVLKNDLSSGDMITANDLAYVNVHPNMAISDSLITNANDLIGNYISRDTSKMEYLYGDHITTEKYERIADKVINTALPIPITQLTSVNGEIRENDFVLISIVVGGTSDEAFSGDIATAELPAVQIIEPPALSAVRVLSIVDSNGQDIDLQKQALQNQNGQISLEESLPQGTMLILDVDARQRALLLQGTSVGKLQLSILPESQQEVYRQQMFGTNTTVSIPDVNILEDESGMTEEEIQKRQAELAQEMSIAEEQANAQLEAELRKKAEELGISYEELLETYQE